MDDYYLDPAQKLIKETLRRGGPMDRTKFFFTCQQCGQQVKLTLRQVRGRKKPKCATCGPTATFAKAGHVIEDATEDAGSET